MKAINENNVVEVIQKELDNRGMSSYSVGLELLKKGKSTHIHGFSNMKSGNNRKNKDRFMFKTVVDIVDVLGGKLYVKWD